MHLVTFLDLILMIFIKLCMFIYTEQYFAVLFGGEGQAASLHPPAPLFWHEQSMKAEPVNSLLCELVIRILTVLDL